jgi:LacI family repressor for deo operon, udp, cdd, tsx, nupC, and nupG
MAKAATIYDVAKRAGVAPSTVSRTFSRPGRVNAETAARVREVAEQLGYRTRRIAQSPTSTHTGMVALTVSDIGNPFYLEIIRGAEAAASAAGCTMLLSDTHESGPEEQHVLERTLPLVDGIVLAGSRMSDTVIRTAAKQRPVVVLNRVVTDLPSIAPDHALGARSAVIHLAELGHRRVTYLAGPDASWADGMRWRAVLEAGQELGVKVGRLGPYEPTVGGGAQAAHELAAAAGAVIAYNDQMAIGLMRGIAQRGGRVPDDVSVVGFDNIFAADLVLPGLTTVAAPLREMGSRAVETLLAREARTFERPMVLPTRLVVRGSTGQPSRKSTSPA